MRILTGIQPSGILHVGNYFGAIHPFVESQGDGQPFAFVADYHALTQLPEPDSLREMVTGVAVDWLACGVDPQKTVFFRQSDVPEVVELMWILCSQIPVGLLERCTNYKDKIAQGITANFGLFSYPVLMAADILLFKSNVVPVGRDQKQHLEMTRDMAIRFNNTFGETLVVPESDIEKFTHLIPGTDGQKMSKSYYNTIPIFDSEKKIRKMIMRIVTDATDINEPKDKETPLFQLYSLFLDEAGQNELTDRYDGKGLQYGFIKQEFFEKVMDHFGPFREKREQLVSNPNQVNEILDSGAKKAQIVADEVLDRVRSACGITYR